MLAPVAALAAVIVIAATAGPSQPRTANGSSAPSTAPLAGAATPGPARATAGRPSSLAVSAPVLPVSAWDLPVRSLTSLLADRAAGTVRLGLVAVAGLLAHDPRSARCPLDDPTVGPAFCHRSGLLAPAPDPFEGGTYTFGEPGPGPGRSPDGIASLRLPVMIPAGIPMPASFAADPPPTAPGGPMLSVVIGRYTSAEPAACGSGSCRDDFVVERLAWLAGTWVDRILVRDPTLPESLIPSTGTRSLAIASREADRMEQILSLAIVQPAWLAAFDASIASAAAAGAGAAGVTPGPVWYLRSEGRRRPGEDRGLTWAVIDHGSGLVLASGAVPA
jgi:hypothetical protein